MSTPPEEPTVRSPWASPGSESGSESGSGSEEPPGETRPVADTGGATPASTTAATDDVATPPRGQPAPSAETAPGQGGPSPWAPPGATVPHQQPTATHQPWGPPAGSGPGGYGQGGYGPTQAFGQQPGPGGPPGYQPGRGQHPGYGPPPGPNATSVWAPPGGAPGWGAPGPGWGGPYPPRQRRRFPWKIVGLILVALLLIALVVVGLLAFVVGPRFARIDVLDQDAVAQGVTRVVTEDWRRQISGVTCPSDQEVRPGVTFTCSATVDGRPVQVPVSVVDTTGTYSVGQPR